MGLEPTTSAVTGRHSNQLNHRANVSVSDSYIYYHTFCILARGFLKKFLEKVFQWRNRGLLQSRFKFEYHQKCLSTIRNYITLKRAEELQAERERLSTIRNYITLKQHKLYRVQERSLSTIRNYITLKLSVYMS